MISDQCHSCGVAKTSNDQCPYCGTVYPEKIPTHTPPLPSLDAKYKISKDYDGVLISWDWRTGFTSLLIVPFAFVWNYMHREGWMDLFAGTLPEFPFPAFFMGVGVFLLYTGLATLLNKTTIHANSQSLRVKHFPVPYYRTRLHKAANIQQLFVSRAQKSSKNRTWHVPVLQVIDNKGRRHKLLKGNAEEEFADYEALRLNLMDALGIKSSEVIGDFTNPTQTRRT